MKNLIWFIFAGTRGGETRARIINILKKRPSNVNQLAANLKLDYKTVQHHLRILEKHKLVEIANKGGYGAVYFNSSLLEANMNIFNEIWEKVVKVTYFL